MGAISADIRYAWRSIRSSPRFTTAAVAALALGIGANTAIFGVIDRVMLEPLPYRQPEQIMRLGRQFPGGKGYSNSITKYMVWRNNDVFQAMTIYGQTGPGMSFGSGDRPEQVKTQQVSKNYFRVFGAVPVLGRTFNDTEDLPHGPLVAVLNYRFWQNRLAGDPQVIGRSVILNKQPYTVIGVMERAFESTPPTDLWISLPADPDSTNQGHYLTVAGRLTPGVTLSQARAAMRVAGERFRQANPKWMDPAESVAVVPMADSMVENVRLALLLLLGAVGFVLLIACANVANTTLTVTSS
jgi:predicted permease